MAITEEDVPAAKKMKTTTEDDHEEVLLAYPPRKKEDGKKMKKVVKRLGKEEVERLLSVTVTVPTLSKEAMEEDDEEDGDAAPSRMRKDQVLIRSQFEAKGYVDVLDEVSDDDDDMEMEPL
ncbi:hypothetical protein DAI22_11g013432 [Oryza sativa Japonica Group]|nr:hypothetical protein DAI22_11g013432 [Oryza sativa Japonica Group]